VAPRGLARFWLQQRSGRFDHRPALLRAAARRQTAGCRASGRAPTPRLRHVVGPAPGDGAADPGDALVEDTAVTADILNMGLHWLGCRRRTARRRVAPRPPQWLLGAVVGVGDEAIERWSTLRSGRWPCCLLFPCSRRSLEPASMPRRRGRRLRVRQPAHQACRDCGDLTALDRRRKRIRAGALCRDRGRDHAGLPADRGAVPDDRR
jgi:hypothetical protein